MKSLKVFFACKLVVAISLIVLLFPIVSFAQIVAKPLENYSKIRFEYVQNSNVRFDATGVYADTLLLKSYFPNLPHQLVKSIGESSQPVGFIAISDLKKEDIKKLCGIHGHSNFLITGVYDKRKNRTTIEYSRIKQKDDTNKNQLEALFNQSYGNKVTREIELDYNKNTYFEFVGMSEIRDKLDVQRNNIRWTNPNQLEGIYDGVTSQVKYTNAITLDENLDPHVSPVKLFGNANIGVKKIESLNSTIELLSLVYE